MEQQTQPQLNLDLKNTTAIKGFDGGQVFGQGVILRKVSKFVSSIVGYINQISFGS